MIADHILTSNMCMVLGYFSSGEKESLNIKALLFDLDGTLTDPKIGIVRCIKYALEQMARPFPSDEILASFIGPPLRGVFSILLKSTDNELIEEALVWYRQRFTDIGLYENQIYEGIPEMLVSAQQVTAMSFVATSKPTVYAQRIIKHFELDRHFSGIYGAELGGQFENKADLLAHLLINEGIQPEDVVMIGDRAVDIIAAKANRVRSVGVLWGYGSEKELIEAGADVLCRLPSELGLCLSQIRV
ncbi:MAG: HAD hydrolase-like protein [Acidobacteriota bacterium]